MSNYEKMFFLSGLPRTGSNLLSAILSQNPKILSEGTSGMVHILAETEKLITTNEAIVHTLTNTNRLDLSETILKSIASIYYKETSAKYVIDKNRYWTNPVLINQIKKYITKDPKIIVMLRPIKEIIESLSYIAQKNDKMDWFYSVIRQGNPLMYPLEFLKAGVQENKRHFLFVNYKDLVNNPRGTINKVYKFLDIKPFAHDFEEVIHKYPEGDYDIPGLHDVRKNISTRELNVELEERILEYANYLQKDLELVFKEAGINHVF